MKQLYHIFLCVYIYKTPKFICLPIKMNLLCYYNKLPEIWPMVNNFWQNESYYFIQVKKTRHFLMYSQKSRSKTSIFPSGMAKKFRYKIIKKSDIFLVDQVPETYFTYFLYK